MNRKNLFFVLIMIFLIILIFGILYFIGFLNYFNSKYVKNIKILDFTFLPKYIAVIYLVILTVFLVLVALIIIKIIISLKNESSQLTAIDIDDYSVEQDNKEKLAESYNKLVDSIDKKLTAIKKYTEIIDEDLEKMDKVNYETALEKTIESILQNFSHMVKDIIQSATISELFDRIIFWGVSLSNSKRGSIMIVNKEKQLYIFKTIGWNEEELKKFGEVKIPLGQGISGKVASENKRIFVTNVENYEDFDFKNKDKYKTKSFVSMPIFGIKNVVAVLNLTENKEGLYSINDLEIINILTSLSSKIYELIQYKKKIK
ncbi:MAG: GAF domain-containing protein [Spirochaetes bacterium]|nr:GAF domain-containing protein [Spirochaetota bacterium]